MKVLRKSKVLEFSIKLSTNRKLIPAHIKGRPPSYYIIAGFVFSTVSVPYLRSEVSSKCTIIAEFFVVLFLFIGQRNC